MRMKPNDRKAELLQAALRLSVKKGWQNVTHRDVAEAANCSTGLVMYYFRTMPKLHRAVMSEALRAGNVPVLAQGLAAKDPKARKASGELREQVLQHLAGA